MTNHVFRTFMAFSLVGLILLSLIFCQVPVSAAPFEASGPHGWVEIKANVPKDFQEDLSVTLQAEDGSSRTVFVLAENNYIGRMRLKAGTYDVMSAGVVNDTKMRFPTDWSPYLVEIKESGAAALITMTVTAPDTYQPVVSPNSASGSHEEPEAPDVVPDASTGSSTGEETSGTSNSDSTGDTEGEVLTGNSSSEPEHVISKEETPDPSEKSEGGFWSGLRNLGITLAAMLVFIGIVCAVVYFVRKHEL